MKKAEAQKTTPEFRRFKELAGKLVTVPKAELEQQRAKDERGKEKGLIKK